MVKHVSYKKPIIFIIGFLFFAAFCKAQDLNKVRQLFVQNDLQRAKESVDSLVLLNAASAEAWLLKAGIYNAISKDANVKYVTADSRMDAFKALQKAVQLNSSYVETQLNPVNYYIAFDLYNGYTNEAITYFNAGAERKDKASYREALAKFKNAALVSNYIYSNRWGLSTIDTNNIYYCFKSSINAGNEYDALFYCKKLADNNITQNTTVKSFESLYQWLVFYYKKQQDGENLDKYAQLGMQLFPSSVYFNLILVDWQRQQKDYDKLFAGYQALFNKQPVNSKYQLAYWNDVFNYLYESELEIGDRSLYERKLSKGLLQFIKTNPSNTDARLLLAKLYINQANDVVKESLLRSTIDTKIMNGYKTAQRNLLLKADVHLKQVLNKEVKATNKMVYKEARKLLTSNNIMLKMLKQ